ncbi:MAG: DUF4405 domain-containing protein [Nevskiaceae bacterium]|nr:MAG: DUF4405 domain-containing protein [Nevskiaceae bacterium]
MGTWLSGALWLAVHYGLRRPGPFGVPTPSPLEPWSLALHGAFAFASLALGGWLLAEHLPPAWYSARSRISGLAMVIGGAVLVVTGYLLFYVAGDCARAVIGIVHWGLGLATPGLLLAHLIARRLARRPAS